MKFPETFTTARLRAERLTAEHWSELRRMHTDPAVMTHLGGVQTEAQTAEYLAYNLQHWEGNNFGLWILYGADGNLPVGRAVLRHVLIEGVDEVEVGYGFYPEHWGRGLATEVTTACLELGFRQLGLQSMVALTSPANLASHHVLLKAGLVYEREFDYHGARCSLFRTGTRTTFPDDPQPSPERAAP
jgi:RimJ/RimL family protein N-acetyltransferase